MGFPERGDEGLARQVYGDAEQRDQRRRRGAQPCAAERFAPRRPCLEVEEHVGGLRVGEEAELGEPRALPRLRRRRIDLEDADAGHASLREAVEAGTEDHVRADLGLGEGVVRGPLPGDDRGAVRRRTNGIHIGAVAPAGVGVDEREPDGVFDDVRGASTAT